MYIQNHPLILSSRERRLLLRLVGVASFLSLLGGFLAPAGAQSVAEPLPSSAPTGSVEGVQAPPAAGRSLPGLALEQAISGLGYTLGPGDVLTIVIWSPQPISHQLEVTVEGKLLIPYVGELDVNHLLLSDAKEAIRRELLRNYRNVDMSITLTALRRFQIYVLGQVQSPGSYLATAVDRVSTMVERAGGFQANASQRSILVQSGDSLRTTADLFAFLRRGLGDRNPYVSDGDRILVPFAKDFITVLGQVNAAGRMQFRAGDRLSDAILLAGGFATDAFLDTLEVARYVEGHQDPFRFFVVNGGDLVPTRPEDQRLLPEPKGRFTPPTPAMPIGVKPSYVDFVLQPEDVLLVRLLPNARLRELVEVRGEVKFPGSYPIDLGRTRLSDLIQWAGGLTPDAFLAEAKLIRAGRGQAEADPEFERLKKIPVADMQEREYGYFKMKSRQLPGQMVVDFEQALHHGSERDNILLERGDIVDIPPRKEYVQLLGMVARPGNVTFRPGLNASGYVRAAGGFADRADKGDMRVIKAGTGEWMKPGEAGKLSPGDVVFVPEKPKSNFWSLFRETLTVAAQLAAIYLVFETATN